MANNNVDINQTVRVEGEPDTFKVNDGLRKISEWWARLKRSVGTLTTGGTQFVGSQGSEEEPSYNFRESPTSGLWIAPGHGTVRYSRLGRDYGALSATNFYCRLKKTANQNITASTWTAITWSSAEDDIPGGMWDSGANTRISIPHAGFYLVIANIYITPIASGFPAGARCAIAHNGTRVPWRENRATTANYNAMCAAYIVWAEQDDYFTVQGYQSGTATESALANLCWFMAKRLG